MSNLAIAHEYDQFWAAMIKLEALVNQHFTFSEFRQSEIYNLSDTMLNSRARSSEAEKPILNATHQLALVTATVNKYQLFV